MDDLEDPEVREFAEPWAVEVTQAVPGNDGGRDVVNNEKGEGGEEDCLGRCTCEMRRVEVAPKGGLRGESHLGQPIGFGVVPVLEEVGRETRKGERPYFICPSYQRSIMNLFPLHKLDLHPSGHLFCVANSIPDVISIG